MCRWCAQTPEWVVYQDVTLTSQEFMREVTAIKATWLTQLAQHYFELKAPEVRAAAPVPAAALAALRSNPKAMDKKRKAKEDDAAAAAAAADDDEQLPVKISFSKNRSRPAATRKPDDDGDGPVVSFGAGPRKRRSGLGL